MGVDVVFYTIDNVSVILFGSVSQLFQTFLLTFILKKSENLNMKAVTSLKLFTLLIGLTQKLAMKECIYGELLNAF